MELKDANDLLQPGYTGLESGYVRLGDWWRLGAIVSVVNVVIWLGVGGVWWKVVGVW